jgi:hypothetical protein
MIDVAAYVAFAAAFWIVGLFAYLSVYAVSCGISRGCFGPSGALPFEVFSAVLTGGFAMWAAIALAKALHPTYPAREFAAVSTGFTVLFCLWTAIDWIEGKGRRDPYELNQAVRFLLTPTIGCLMAWLLPRIRRGLPAASDAVAQEFD